MPAFLVDWLDRLPAVQLLALFCVFFLAIALFGVGAIHPHLRRHLHGDEPSNEVIIFSAANFGLLYAVLLGLLTIATFQTTKDVVDTIGRKASSLSTLYNAADGYPDPVRAQLKAELRDYTRYVIDKDWPAHRRGLVLMGGEHRLQEIRRTLLSFEPTTKTREALQNAMLNDLTAMTVAREERLSAVTAAIPNVLWHVVIIGALLTVTFMWMLHMKLMSQILLGSVTALFLGIMLFLIFAMDRPLQGAVSVTPGSFQSVYEQVMKWDD
ncbi:MAG: DUF4239 domain-containing protein [Hyphomicrobiales bacterium]|nr:DUF4239 domain-containing protein [Hyphomicrobiales bacterium]MBV9907432.1 DUF4239 domain-containing protein [Hyphomicrobiales bacterium]